MSSKVWIFACAIGLSGAACQRIGAPAAGNVVPAVEAPAAAPVSHTQLPAAAGREPVQHVHAPLAVCKSKGDPLEAARHFYDSAKYEDALSCAAQATAFFPELPQSYSEKGAALSALGRYDEAQFAYARALAIQPNHLDALLGAAHLFAVSLQSSRENDELASVYAEKGLALARAQKDPSLIAQFALVSAMAFNDLGQASDALGRAAEVLKHDPANVEAGYERAVALFELCRFKDAKAAFQPLLEDKERGPHAHHHLGLILEREGKYDEAEKHFALARKLAPEDFPEAQMMSVEEFKAAVARAIQALPADMRADLERVPVTAEDIPRDEDLTGGEPPLSPTILGLFRGPSLSEPCTSDAKQPCRSVALYRRNLARAVQSREELLDQIRVTLLHELGHLRGEDDYELAARGLE